jgi:hypothetical protein
MANPCTNDDQVTPTIYSYTPSNFSGANFRAGDYYVAYVRGALEFSYTGHGWQVASYFVTDGAGNVVALPSSATQYTTQADCEAAHSGEYITYTHSGGKPIGVYLVDSPYDDNVSGTPNPTYQLCGPIPALEFTALPDSVCYSGLPATLSWSSTNADSLSIDNGIGSVGASGSVIVSPAVTTTYTLTATTNGVTVTASATVTVVHDVYSVTPDILSGTVSYFKDGTDFGAGTYQIGYSTGAYQYNPLPVYGWTVNGNTSIESPINGYTPGFKITDGVGNVIDAPGNTDEYDTPMQCQAANVGLQVLYTHSGGNPIGVYLNDMPYYDNVAGSPNPTFTLMTNPLMASLSASASVLMAGQSSTLTWTSANATSVTLNGDSVDANGTLSVSPTQTTEYLLVASDGCISMSRAVTTTVNQPTIPGNLTAAPQCSDTIFLSWEMSQYIDHYLVEHSIDGLTGWTSDGTTTQTEMSVHPIEEGAPYYYRVSAVSGSIATPSNIVVAASVLLPSVPSGLVVTPLGGRYRLSWTVPTGSYNVLTANIYEGTVSGSENETPIATGVDVAKGFYVVADRVNGQPYYVTVTFSNFCGTSAQSVEVFGTPQCCAEDYVQEAGSATICTQESATTNVYGQAEASSNSLTQEGAETTAYAQDFGETSGFTQEGCS